MELRDQDNPSSCTLQLNVSNRTFFNSFFPPPASHRKEFKQLRQSLLQLVLLQSPKPLSHSLRFSLPALIHPSCGTRSTFQTVCLLSTIPGFLWRPRFPWKSSVLYYFHTLVQATSFVSEIFWFLSTEILPLIYTYMKATSFTLANSKPYSNHVALGCIYLWRVLRHCVRCQRYNTKEKIYPAVKCLIF